MGSKKLKKTAQDRSRNFKDDSLEFIHLEESQDQIRREKRNKKLREKRERERRENLIYDD